MLNLDSNQTQQTNELKKKPKTTNQKQTREPPLRVKDILELLL